MKLNYKTCSKCKQKKPTNEFYRHSQVKDKLNSWCKQCTNKLHKEYQQKHKKRIKEKQKEWFQKNKEKMKKWYQEHRKERIQQSKESEQRRKVRASSLVGNICFFCSSTKNLLFHEITGQDHSGKNTITLVLKNPEKFRRLCIPCHKGVHFCMEILNLSWKEIEKEFLKKK